MPKKSKKKSTRSRKPVSARKTRGQSSRRSKKQSKKTKQKTKQGWRGYINWRSILSLLFVLGLLWIIYLDVVIRTQFEGKRWALPAQVYGRPMELFVGKTISTWDFQRELELLGYRYAYRVNEPGTFFQQDTRFRVFAREFQFWDEEVGARLVDINFTDGKIASIYYVKTGKALDLVRLEAPKIGGIYPAHQEDRILIQLDDAPRLLRQGLIAVEDHQFHQHHGINPRAIARALLANLKAGKTVQGGSTLTQQLIKNFFLNNERTLWRKANEAMMALLMEWHYDKDEILEAYLNEIYLGQQNQRAIHGFGLASRFYFDRPVSQLNLSQVAGLIALVRGPSFYDPNRHPTRLLKRRNLVLDIMHSRGVINQSEASEAKLTGLAVVKGRASDSHYPAFMDLVRRHLKRDYRQQDLTSEGLRIFTSFDPLIQKTAERSLSRRLKQLDRLRGLKGKLQGAVVVTDTTSGEVLAVVGDRNPQFAGFNRALDAVRPIGSLIKPVVYLTALEQPDRYSLASPIEDNVIKLKGPDGNVWSPKNYDGKSHGTVPLFSALVNSYNQATVRLGMSLGFEPILNMLQRMGVQRNISPYPSMLLGATAFSPYEVAGLYQTLASGGFKSPLRVIREVTDVQGAPLRRFPLLVEQVVDPAPVAAIVSAMHQVTLTGTAQSLQKSLPEELTVAGKTGTTNNLRDSWFAGFSGNHLAVVWVGLDNNQSMGLSGSSGALRVWSQLMKSIPNLPLEPASADNISNQWIDSKTGLLSEADCENAVYLAFIVGTEPEEHGGCGSRKENESNWFRSLFK